MPLLEKRDYRPKINLTPEIAQYLKDNCTSVKIQEMADKLGVSASKVQTWRKELNLLGTRVDKMNMTDKVERHSDYFSWSSAAQQDFIVFRP